MKTYKRSARVWNVSNQLNFDARSKGLPSNRLRRRSGHRFSYRDTMDMGYELSAIDRLFLLCFSRISERGRGDKTGAESTKFPIYGGWDNPSFIEGML